MKTGGSVDFESFPEISAEQLRAYADASGDNNPIHLDEAVATRAGLPGVIAHGMLIAAFVCERALRYVNGKAPEEGWTMSSSKMRFKAMTRLGDVVSVGGVVKDAKEALLVLELQARNQRGENLVLGRVEFKRSRK